MSMFSEGIEYAFGGFIQDEKIRFNSTSGGAFSAIVDTYCDENYVIFGAEAEGINVLHSYITDKTYLQKFRKSKYSQSEMGSSYKDAKDFLDTGKKVLFSGTPCQIAGLKKYLEISKTDSFNLLTIEVVCEGVPSPLYIRKYEQSLEKKYGRKIESLDYRYKGESRFNCGKWDFEAMKTKLYDNKKEIIVDRWFNPFWKIWIGHLMSRPSCNKCVFARPERTADITLGDLWGVHLFCPELYGNNKGASVIFANTDKGKDIVLKTQKKMFGHELKVEEALNYQSPMKKHIEPNENREDFMKDLMSDMTYEKIIEKWAEKPSFNLLFQKYMWGNRQKIFFWKLTKGKYKIK